VVAVGQGMLSEVRRGGRGSVSVEERVRDVLQKHEINCTECQTYDLQGCLPPYPQCAKAGCHVGAIVRVLKAILGAKP
jgi:hypothetical protein